MKVRATVGPWGCYNTALDYRVRVPMYKVRCPPSQRGSKRHLWKIFKNRSWSEQRSELETWSPRTAPLEGILIGRRRITVEKTNGIGLRMTKQTSRDTVSVRPSWRGACKGLASFERPRRPAPDFCCKKTTLQKIMLLFCEKVIHRLRSKKSYPQDEQFSI